MEKDFSLKAAKGVNLTEVLCLTDAGEVQGGLERSAGCPSH